MLRVSVAVVLIAPRMLMLAIRWMLANLLATPIDPLCLLLEPSANTGRNHIPAP